MGLVLTLDAALDGCAAGLVLDGVVVAERAHDGVRGAAAQLPALAQQVLDATGATAASLAAIAVTVGPGSFTGVRAALALAHGIGVSAGVPVAGVTVGAAVRAALRTERLVWVAIDSKRGRVFLDDGDTVRTMSLDALPRPPGPILVAGNAAQAVAGWLSARGHDAQASVLARAGVAGIALAAVAAPGPAQPLYVDPPEARPNQPIRPAPGA